MILRFTFPVHYHKPKLDSFLYELNIPTRDIFQFLVIASITHFDDINDCDLEILESLENEIDRYIDYKSGNTNYPAMLYGVAEWISKNLLCIPPELHNATSVNVRYLDSLGFYVELT